MNICICGWYFDSEFYTTIRWKAEEYGVSYPIFVIAHKEPPKYRILLNEYAVHANVGLEFGAYAQYLEKHWDRESDVLFIQDDTRILDVGSLLQIHDLAGNPAIDQAFIFNNEWEEVANKGKHGRAIWCRGSFLKRMQEDGGMPYDRENFGENMGEKANNGIEMFTRYCNRFPKAGWIAIVPGIQHGRRGELPSDSYVYHRSTRQGAKLIPGAPNPGVLAVTVAEGAQ